MSVKEKLAVNIPVWAVVGAIVIGGKKASQRLRKFFKPVGMEKSVQKKKAAFRRPGFSGWDS